MKKIFILILFIILFYFNTAYALSTEEIAANDLYKKFEKIVYTPYYISDISYSYTNDTIDYAVQIVKYKPDSMAAYLSITGLIGLDINAKTKKKYEELKSKYYNALDNYEEDMPEKVILLELMMYYMENDETLSLKQRAEINIGKIMKFSNECNDKRYSALADSILFTVGTNEERMKKYEEFKIKYPDYPAMPYVELEQISRYSTIKEYQKCIEETEKLIKKYGNIESPSGYKMIVDFYELLFDCYFDMNDKGNAELYLSKIESECPNYVGLYRLKEQISRIGKDPFDIFNEDPDETEEIEVNE